MPARLRRTARSFAVVFAAFWAYRLLVAPWIDPSFALEEQPGASAAEISRVREADKLRAKKYARIFPPGSWELDQPIMLESEGVELLMKDYENLSDGRIKLTQCTMLYLANRQSGGESGGVVVLRAREGAVLQFDADLNLRRGKVGKLIGGELKGPVTIHGTPSKPGADDELFITTRDVRMNQHKVWSHSVVEFRYGPNEGRGRELVMHLVPAGGSGQRRGPNIGGVERIELLHDVAMHLLPGAAGFFPGDDRPAEPSVPSEGAAKRAAEDEAPVDIRCRGPFQFNLAERMASFENQVDVYRTVRQGVSDQMTCEVLQIYFGDKSKAGPPTQKLAVAKTGLNDDAKQTNMSLQPERIVATGFPVTVNAPSSGAHVLANRLEYEMLSRRAVVQAAPKQPDASLSWTSDTFSGKFVGRSLDIARPDPRALPLVTAAGPGSFHIADPNDPASALKASWSRELNMRPVEGSHQVSLVGNANANFAEFGDLNAGKIDLWLLDVEKLGVQRASPLGENPNARASTVNSRKTEKRDPRRYPVTPARLLAIANVRFDSPQLTGDSQRLDVQFDPLGTLLPTPMPSAAAMRLPQAGLLGLNPARHGQTEEIPPGGPVSAPRGASNGPSTPAKSSTTSLTNSESNNADASVNAQAQLQRFELHGNSIDVQVVSQGELTQVNHVTIDGKVRLLETRTELPTDRPMDVQGDWLEVKNAATARQTTVVVVGRPAFIAARGMEMSGARINLDRGQNLLWIDGVGRMILPPTEAEQGSAAKSSTPSHTTPFDAITDAPVRIDFAGGMRFDGKLAQYRKEVVVRNESQDVRPNHPLGLETQRLVLETDAVEVTLQQPIDFAADQTDADAKVEKIACLGPVGMTQRTSDNRGEVAVDSLVTRDLTIYQTTGAIHAFGPGTLESTRLDTGGLLTAQTVAKPANAAAPKPDSPVYVRVDYQGEITGNINDRDVVLHDDIRGVYGPVERWTDKIELGAARIGPDEVRFRSDKLKVSQVAGVQPKSTTLQLSAVGNTTVFGDAFTAYAHRLTYEQGKHQLIFDGAGPNGGEGHNDAILYYQPQPGGPQTEARAGTITYWPATRARDYKIEVDKARTVQFWDLGRSIAPPTGLPVR